MHLLLQVLLPLSLSVFSQSQVDLSQKQSLRKNSSMDRLRFVGNGTNLRDVNTRNADIFINVVWSVVVLLTQPRNTIFDSKAVRNQHDFISHDLNKDFGVLQNT
jgi:hypothetical protein